jgi:hypothetical protein
VWGSADIKVKDRDEFELRKVIYFHRCYYLSHSVFVAQCNAIIAEDTETEIVCDTDWDEYVEDTQSDEDEDR